jgi:hypothetical protein
MPFAGFGKADEGRFCVVGLIRKSGLQIHVVRLARDQERGWECARHFVASPISGDVFQREGVFMHKKAMAQAAALVLTGLVASAAIAADNKPAQPMESTSGGSLQVAFIDPVTKKLRAATPEEAANFAKKLDAQRALQARLPSTSGRPRTDAEALQAARTVRVNGYTMVVADTPETEINYLVGMVDAEGNLVGAHPADNAATTTAVEVTK